MLTSVIVFITPLRWVLPRFVFTEKRHFVEFQTFSFSLILVSNLLHDSNQFSQFALKNLVFFTFNLHTKRRSEYLWLQACCIVQNSYIPGGKSSFGVVKGTSFVIITTQDPPNLSSSFLETVKARSFIILPACLTLFRMMVSLMIFFMVLHIFFSFLSVTGMSHGAGILNLISF